MCKIINLERWRRTRRRREEPRRARFAQARETQHRPGLVSIGIISEELLRRLNEDV